MDNLTKDRDQRGRPLWFDDALCAGEPIDWFYPEKTDDQIYAIDTCSICPVQGLCLTHALQTRESNGVWGGTSEADRGKAISDGIRTARDYAAWSVRLAA